MPKVSLRTHCPVMIRHVVNGRVFPEEVCRCDIPAAKRAHHPFRCASTTCAPRKALGGSREPIDPDYKLLEPFDAAPTIKA